VNRIDPSNPSYMRGRKMLAKNLQVPERLDKILSCCGARALAGGAINSIMERYISLGMVGKAWSSLRGVDHPNRDMATAQCKPT